ncbi:Epi-isozizaene 5-monooxygenase/(E)-beta-farnesene synthase [Dyadobacter sp. CECT 9623]|uniref:Epi-isozizaene 5-monooxygenase/(E)-beta-farnesene synthase n=1 Tax=Dyadobacter linearis TaxID=2823330 RepID=A0ABN7R5I0_9BACT|nr:cytochrome P450 [Dyadobacter sp. CECT 9623]CAG5068797.1 Epi-isozizaene 5-monooxygenase/(E)-beta-farnesene synthase [Dyadobacter sp. CECT 9623]
MRPIPEFRISSFSLVGAIKFARDPLHFLHQGFETCGDTFKIKLFREFVISREPGFFRHILQQHNKNFKKGSSSKMLQPVLGNGLVTSEGDFWLRQRRLVQPAFHRERLQELFLTMGELTRSFLDEMEQHRGKEAIDIDAKMMGVTSDIALKTLFGNMTSEDKAQIYKQVSRTQKYLVTRVRRPYRRPLMAINGENRHFKTDITYFNKLIFDFIEQRRLSGEAPNDLLQLLLDSTDEDTGEQMNDLQIRDEAITMFAAGHETSATALSWLLWELSKQPEIVARIRQECAVFETVPSFEQLMRMPYTRQVVEEGLRLYPPAWTMTREATVDQEIEGYHVPKGTSVFLSVFELHRNPHLWENPFVFNPGNFSAEHVKNRAKFNYLPFGAGPRICIGLQFAMMEMQLILSALLKRFTFENDPAHEVGMHPQIVLKSTNGIKLYVK